MSELEAIEGLLFRLRIMLSVPPSLDCVSQIDDEGEQRNFFIREVFEASLANYCKACADIVEEIDDLLQSSNRTTRG